MKPNNIIFFILSVLVFSSCEYELDFSGEDKIRRLFVLGMPGSSDTTFVRLHSTIPMGDRVSRPLPLDEAGVSLIVNGEEIVMKRADEAVPALQDGIFYTLHPVAPGDRVEVRASAEGAEPVWAECLVPESFPENEIVMEIDRKDGGNYSRNLKFSVTFPDDIGTVDHYAMQVCRRKEHYTYSIDGGYQVQRYEYEIVGVEEDDAGQDDLYPFRKPIIVNYNAGIDLYSKEDAPMVIFDDRTFEDGAGVIELITRYEEDRMTSSTWIDDVLQDGFGYKCSYRVILYRLSPELYNFIRSNAILEMNLPILIGAAPPSYVYTNIRGGVGIFGGISVTETDWIPNIEQ